MERLVGHIPRSELPPEVRLSRDEVRELCTKTLDLLVDLHAVDPVATGLGSLGKGEGYVGRQVSGWSGRYRKAKTWNVGSFEKVMAWLDASQPADGRTCLIHNDFRLDNVVYAQDEPTRREVVDYYCARSGFEVTDEERAFYYVFGLFRLAVILQQIYYRYSHKQTTNPAFRNFWLMVNLLDLRCRKIIRTVGS